MSQPICRHCVAGVQLFKHCLNLSTGHCAAGLQLFKAAAVAADLPAPVAGVQLFKQCQNLCARTVLQGCSCLSGVATYLPGTVLQLFKRCRNLSAGLCCRGAAV